MKFDKKKEPSDGLEITEDSSCVIIYRQFGIIIYYNLESDESWIIVGHCNKCGECLPETWIEIPNRRDIPVRPEIKNRMKNCSLEGVYC